MFTQQIRCILALGMNAQGGDLKVMSPPTVRPALSACRPRRPAAPPLRGTVSVRMRDERIERPASRSSETAAPRIYRANDEPGCDEGEKSEQKKETASTSRQKRKTHSEEK